MRSEKRKVWKLWGECGWFKVNPPVGLLLKFGEIIEDYPTGWASITLIGLQLGKLSVAFGIHFEREHQKARR